MKLAEHLKSLPLAAPGMVTVPPTTWADTWNRRPTEPVVLGLRMVSEYDKREIQRIAKERAMDSDVLHGDREDVYNDGLMRLFVGFAVCDPNDSSKDSPVLGDLPLETVFSALTESGARYLFDAAQRTEIEKSPRYLEASDEEVAILVDQLVAGSLDSLAGSDAAMARRHLRYVLEMIYESETALGVSEILGTPRPETSIDQG